MTASEAAVAARRSRTRSRSGLTAERVRARVREAGRPAEPGRAGDVLAAVERALRLQALQEAAAHAAHRGRARGHGPRRERRRGRRRRRAGVRVQGRVPQPPERRRALPGRGHRRRRHPARHLRDRRAPDRGARLAALRRARRRRASRYLLDGAVVGIGHYGNSIGVPDGRRRGLLRGALRAELPRQRDGARAGPARAARAQRRRRARATCSCCSAPPPAATASAAPRCSPPRSSATRRRRAGQAPDRPGRRPVRGEEAARVLAGAARARACSSRCRTSAPPG